MLDKIKLFIKGDIVLTVSWVLAIISAFFVRPSKEYISYIDFRTLGILWSLMVIMEVFKQIGIFEYVGIHLLNKTKRIWQLVLVLILLCFFSSMFITNDVALITFVPFSIMILDKCGRRELFIPVISLQTIAANLGSMIMPIGNPQNLYLYSISGISLSNFIKLVFPFSMLSLILLVLAIFLLKGKSEEIKETHDIAPVNALPYIVVAYTILFVVAFLVVLRVTTYKVLVAGVLVISLLLYRKILLSVDYGLLFTFIGFFIFIGNMGNIEVVKNMLQNIVVGNEVATGVVASQFISNVPAALLLSGFTNNFEKLILGVNFGGLGTLIASMASLISYKQYASQKDSQKGKYLLYFTVFNILFLVALLLLYAVI